MEYSDRWKWRSVLRGYRRKKEWRDVVKGEVGAEGVHEVLLKEGSKWGEVEDEVEQMTGKWAT